MIIQVEIVDASFIEFCEAILAASNIDFSSMTEDQKRTAAKNLVKSQLNDLVTSYRRMKEVKKAELMVEKANVVEIL